MNKEATLPILWTTWDEDDVLVNQYHDVAITDDFGVFKQGENFDHLVVDYGVGKISVFNDNGDIIKEQKFISKPID